MLDAPILLADSAIRTILEPEPLFSVGAWAVILLVVAVCIIALCVSIVFYMLDGADLPPGITATLITLRILAFAGLLVFFLNPVLRSEKRIVKNSRVSIMVDTSLSMGLRDAKLGPDEVSRIEAVVQELDRGSLIRQLRRDHDVVVYRFDQGSKPEEVASFPKSGGGSDAQRATLSVELEQSNSITMSRIIALAAAGVLLASLLFIGVFLVLRSNRTIGSVASWGLFLGILLLAAGVVALAVANLLSPDVSPLVIFNPLAKPTIAVTDKDVKQNAADADEDEDDEDKPDDKKRQEPDEVNWQDELNVRGTETHLGDAVRYVVNKERGGPVAGIVVFSDGRDNRGVEPTIAISIARDAEVPVYTVGLGSTERRANVRIADIEAPERAVKDDDFPITGMLQSYGMSGRVVTVQLISRRDAADGAERLEEERSVELAVDGREVAVEFTVTPQEQGKRVYAFRVKPPPEDDDKTDNEMSAAVEVVDRQNRVLLFAGGPTREFRFLRNMLHRDKAVTLDVLLQSSTQGSSQEGNVIHEMPEEADELFEYDAIVAFDPDWRELNNTQVELLERWVAEKAGGLIIVVGPVYTPEWTRAPRSDQRITTIRALYPISFFSAGSATIERSRFKAEDSFPLLFTGDGKSSEFLWLEDTASRSEAAWNEFEGVYGYYAVNEPKAGATVFARFDDPDTSSRRTKREDDLPIYLAGHFYGAGRVFFQASGEMWRIRSIDDAYFERYYTKLIRWVSQGRLLRDSSRGILMTDKDRCLLGDQVEIRAILSDAQHLPLTDPEVMATIVPPSGESKNIFLKKVKDGARDGTYSGQLNANMAGEFKVLVEVPDSPELQYLTRSVRVRVPDLEIEQPQRNDLLLTEMAVKTGGKTFQGINAVRSGSGRPSVLANIIEPQDQTTYLPGTPNYNFTKVLMGWLLGLVCGALCMEWLVRRLSKLA